MKVKFLIFLFLSLYFNLFSQKKVDTVYIRYDDSIDRHYNKKGQINYFDICINNKTYKRFQYGSSNIIKKTNYNQKTSSRKELYNIIKKDSPNRKIIFIIVKEQNRFFYLYKSDYIFRTITDK